MRFISRSFYLLLVVSWFVLLPLAGATYHFRDNFRVRNGESLHLGSEWLSTSGTDIQVSAWFVDNWVNFSVSTSGVQQVYNGSKPQSVIIDGVNQTEGSGWTYGLGIVTVTIATTSVSIEWENTSTPPIPPIPPFSDLTVQPVTSSEVYGDCVFSFYPQESLVCQHSENIEMEITVLSGAFNGSGTVDLTRNHGLITIAPTTDSIVKFTQLQGNELTVNVNGDRVTLGEPIAINSTSSTVYIEWWNSITPILPIMFLFGMGGLGLLVVGPCYGIQKWRNHDRDLRTMANAIALTAIGFGLFIAWLWH